MGVVGGSCARSTWVVLGMSAAALGIGGDGLTTQAVKHLQGPARSTEVTG